MASTRAQLAVLGVLGLNGAGCGVFFGDPIELFPQKAESDGAIIDHTSPCIEQVTRESPGSIPIVGSVRAANFAALLDGEYKDNIVWPGTVPASIVTVTFSNPVVYSIHSRINEDYSRSHLDAQCADRVRIDADMSIVTADGQLNEVHPVSFEAYTADEAQGTLHVAKAELHGTYAPTSFGKQCYFGTTFFLIATVNGPSGTMDDEFGKSCDDRDAGVIIEQAGGHWGSRAQH